MKKNIPKPTNWQDFEDLCKFLWGELWEIPDKIKKNGRMGQTQNGIDIIGRPKNSQLYSGIQCKIKDENNNSKLSKNEIKIEIDKVKLFETKLETFIIATTANKDVEIEMYVRRLDQESRDNGSFEILLFCWEDIADLISTNRNTYNYYVNKSQFYSNYEMSIYFDEENELTTVQPRFIKYKYLSLIKSQNMHIFNEEKIKKIKNQMNEKFLSSITRSYRTLNYSWIDICLYFENCGTEVIEDYKIEITPENNKIRELSNYSARDLLDELIQINNQNPVKITEKKAIYIPINNRPLTQKDKRSFKLYLLIEHEVNEVILNIEIFARNYHGEKKLTIQVNPIYEEEKIIKWIENEDEKEDEREEITDIIRNASLY